MEHNNQKTILSAIILVGVLIAGAILLKDSKPPMPKKDTVTGVPITTLSPVSSDDRVQGNKEASVTLVMYEDFQCPFCGAVFGSPANPELHQSLIQRDPTWAPFIPGVMADYVSKGTVQFVYRDFAFLGPESVDAAEAARCAGDQGKFWEYHDYLYNHQNGENEGGFSNANLKSFAQTLALDTKSFNTCLDTKKYEQAVMDSKTEAARAGVTGTPKGFILKDGNLVDTIDGAESYTSVKSKIDRALQ